MPRSKSLGPAGISAGVSLLSQCVPKNDDCAASQFLLRQQPSAATQCRDRRSTRREFASDDFVARQASLAGDRGVNACAALIDCSLSERRRRLVRLRYFSACCWHISHESQDGLPSFAPRFAASQSSDRFANNAFVYAEADDKVAPLLAHDGKRTHRAAKMGREFHATDHVDRAGLRCRCAGIDAGHTPAAAASAPKCGLNNGKAATGQPIEIGAIVGKTGPADFSGSAQAAAAYFACVNANGGINGRPIHYSIEDDQWNPETAAQARRQAGQRHQGRRHGRQFQFRGVRGQRQIL